MRAEDEGRMDVDGGYSSAAYAFALHAMVIFLIGFVVRAQVREADRVHDSVIPLMDSAALPRRRNRLAGVEGSAERFR